MLQLIFHLVGDYIVQNDWMALNKKKRTTVGEAACLVHCITYSLPFMFIGSIPAVLAIFLSHYLIDRYEFVKHFIAMRNNVATDDNFGFSPDRPVFIAFWLYVAVDNTFHIICNYLALRYL